MSPSPAALPPVVEEPAPRIDEVCASDVDVAPLPQFCLLSSRSRSFGLMGILRTTSTSVRPWQLDLPSVVEEPELRIDEEFADAVDVAPSIAALLPVVEELELRIDASVCGRRRRRSAPGSSVLSSKSQSSESM